MKKGYTVLCSLMLVLTLVATGCKSKVKSVSERLAKSWTAESVKHGATTVYTRGAASNSFPGYVDFKLTLVEGGSTAVLVDYEKTSSTGKWELTGDTKLTLSNMSPAQTGTGGIIEFTITSIDDSKLVLTRVKGSDKTGGTINVYTLTNP